MKAREIAQIIEEFCPLDTQEKWDNAGFCIGSPDAEVHGVLVGFDCTPALIAEAVAKGADMIVTHHPLIFHGLKKIDPSSFLGSMIFEAIRHGIVIYAAHTNADKAAGGVSCLMADRLGLTECEVLEESGLGIVGNLPEAADPAEFVERVKRLFGLKALRCSRLPRVPIRRVALCGGSGSSLIPAAMAKHADVYICADLHYHDFFCEEGFMLMDIGHYESEIDIVDKLLDTLRKKISNFAVSRTANNNNPIYYH